MSPYGRKKGILAGISVFTMFTCSPLKQMLFMILTGFFTLGADTVVQGKVGQNITLPCRYSVEEYGVADICWGQKSCPLRDCSKPIVRINGNLEISGQSPKYQLMGDIHQGDASLTIVNVMEDDAGTYCCRIKIQGWFNDKKYNLKLVIEKALLHTTPMYFKESNLLLEPRWVSTSESPPDNISSHINEITKEPGKNESSWIGIYIGTGTAAVIFIIIALLIAKWFLYKKQKKINSTSLGAFSRSEAGGAQHVLRSGFHAPENVYDYS